MFLQRQFTDVRTISSGHRNARRAGCGVGSAPGPSRRYGPGPGFAQQHARRAGRWGRVTAADLPPTPVPGPSGTRQQQRPASDAAAISFQRRTSGSSGPVCPFSVLNSVSIDPDDEVTHAKVVSTSVISARRTDNISAELPSGFQRNSDQFSIRQRLIS